MSVFTGRLYRTSHLLKRGVRTLHIAAVHLQYLLWPGANPCTEGLNGGSIYTPLSHTKLSQMGSGVTSKSLPVLKEEATQLTTWI